VGGHGQPREVLLDYFLVVTGHVPGGGVHTGVRHFPGVGANLTPRGTSFWEPRVFKKINEPRGTEDSVPDLPPVSVLTDPPYRVSYSSWSLSSQT